MIESSIRNEDVQSLIDIMAKSKFSPNEPAFAVSGEWIEKFKRSTGYECTATNEQVGKIDNSGILNYLEKQVNKDYFVVSLPVWNGFIKLYGGGPPVEVEVGFDPKNNVYIPLTQLHPFKIYFHEKMEKVMISKFKTVRCLIEAACVKFGLDDPSKYRLRDYWKQKEGRYMFPNHIICEFSFLVNTEMLLESGTYDEIDENEENSRSISMSRSTSKSSTNHQKASFAGITQGRVLGKPDFNSNPTLYRRTSHSYKNFEIEMKPNSQPVKQDKTHHQAISPPPQKAGMFLFDRTSNPSFNCRKELRRSMRISAPALHFASATKGEPLVGINGVASLGNPSDLNAVLQCLIHLKPIKEFFLNSSPLLETEYQSAKMGTPFVAFADFVKSYYASRSALITPVDIKAFVEKVSPYFIGYVQQDAHELLTVLLDAINECFSTDSRMRIASADDNKEGSRFEWEEYMSHSKSIIAKMFYGQTKTTISCTNCGGENISYSPFTSICLQLPSTKAVSPKFIFVPFDPRLPKYALKLQMKEKVITMESFTKALDEHLERHAECVFGHQDSEGNIEWVPSPDAPIPESKVLVVYEVPDKTKLYISVKLSVITTKFLSPIRCVDGPFLVQIPGPNTTQQQVNDILDDYFKYIWEPSTNNCINQDLLQLIPLIKENKSSTSRIEVEISKSIFSKTLSFKATPQCPNISARGVNVIIQSTTGITWSRVMRQTVKNPSIPRKRDVDLMTLINEAATPSIYSNTWKCFTCSKCVKPKKSVKIWHLPPILIFAFKRFEGEKENCKKNDFPVTYPDEISLSDCTGVHNYELSAVCEHRGKLGYGNYVAHAKLDDDQWAEFNDMSAFKCSKDAAHQPNAYILFYLRKPT